MPPAWQRDQCACLGWGAARPLGSASVTCPSFLSASHPDPSDCLPAVQAGTRLLRPEPPKRRRVSGPGPAASREAPAGTE